MRLDGTEVASRFANTRLVPASNQKILTAVYAAATLGMDFRPRTKFWKDGDRFVVDAPGDPTITRAQLLAAKSALGIGSDAAIYVKQAYQPKVPPSWEYDDLPHRYAARVTALSFDKGGFEIWTDNGKLRELDPAYRITVRHFPGNGSAKVDYDPERRFAAVRGTLPGGDKMIEAFAMPDPDVIAARVLGGTIVQMEGALPTRKPDYEIVGPTVREMLKECLEKSDNNMAEHLLLMSATRSKPLGAPEYSEAAERLTAFLEGTVGLDKGSVRPIDGSGMSRHNFVTPRAMCQILAWAHKQTWRDDFLKALAASGEGTLSSRLGSSSFVGKTGTLSAVICLSGYVTTQSGRTLAVSLLFNHTISPSSEVRGLQDRVIAILERG
jgi:D-alanyl-D-alanine carboxypeptidase/D-alanyl-D-alanine-endopeptidase (penicillin-binding protein 4)